MEISWSEIIGWVGVGFMTLAAIPQLRDVKKVSKTTYTMLLLGSLCYLVRAIVIHEVVFIASSILAPISIFLVWRKL